MDGNGPDKKDISDPSYNFSDFVGQLFGGPLRWLATMLALASLALWVFLFIDKKEPEIDFPFHLKGLAVLWVVGLAFFIWLTLAIINWRKWTKRKE
jgi:hypothetical protein